MFSVTRKADYAVRTMLALGEAGPGKRVKVAAICKEMDIPQAFLYQITKALIDHNLVEAYSGPSGGLSLGRSIEEIDLLQIVEAVEGPICVNVCLEGPHACPRDRICPAHSLWGRFQVNIRKQLREAQLSELVEQSRYLKQKAEKKAPILLEEINLSKELVANISI